MMTEHTQGPLTVDDSGNIFGLNGRLVANCAGWQNNREPARDENMANARLIRAVWESYTRCCGERAVECAEGDLLGEALTSIGHLVWLIEKQFKHDGMHITNDAKAILAKAKEKP